MTRRFNAKDSFFKGCSNVKDFNSENEVTKLNRALLLFLLDIKIFILSHTLWFLPASAGLVYAWIVSPLF